MKPNTIFPRMTYYSRVLDNVDGHVLLSWASTSQNKKIYYGRCNGMIGGESEFMVEFDIWNNEPAWDGGTPQMIAQNAANCRLRITIPPESRDLNPFFYARCITYDLNSEFQAVDMAHRELKDIQGNASDEYGSILGVSDHATIQTKIKLKKDSLVKQPTYQFTLDFVYNYE